MLIIHKDGTILRFSNSAGSNPEFLHFMDVSGKIQLGTISKINKYHFGIIHANFGACTTKPTIASHICPTIVSVDSSRVTR